MTQPPAVHTVNVNATHGEQIEVWCSCGTVLGTDRLVITLDELLGLRDTHVTTEASSPTRSTTSSSP